MSRQERPHIISANRRRISFKRIAGAGEAPADPNLKTGSLTDQDCFTALP